jgi:outer membrane PBP1 activator LpoA protein
VSFRCVSSAFHRCWPPLATALILAACGGSRSDRSTVEKIQADAEARVAEARLESQQKLAEAERQVQQLKRDLESARRELDHALRNAVDRGTDEKANERAPTGAGGAAASSFPERRNQAEKQSMARLNEVEREADALAQRARGLGADARVRFDGAMQRVRQQLEIVSNDVGEFDHATEQTLEQVRMRFEQDFAKLREQLDTAKKKLP